MTPRPEELGKSILRSGVAARRRPTARVEGVDPAAAQGPIAAAFRQQTGTWGAPPGSHSFYGSRPTILRAALGMWGKLAASGLISAALGALSNRRVAILNGCEFRQDITAALGGAHGLSDEKLLALADGEVSDLLAPPSGSRSNTPTP